MQTVKYNISLRKHCRAAGKKPVPVLPFKRLQKLPSVSQSNESPNGGMLWLSYKSFLPAYCDSACRGLSYYCIQSYSAQGLSFKTGWRIHLGNTSIWYPTSRQGKSHNACEEKVQRLILHSLFLQPNYSSLEMKYISYYSVGSVPHP